MEEMLRIWNLFVYAFKNAFNYKGRACRMEMVSFVAMYVLIVFVLASVQTGMTSFFVMFPRFSQIKAIFFTLFFAVMVLFFIVAVAMGISLAVRRMHDLNYSGWWVLLITVLQVVPVVKIFAALAAIYYYFIKKGGVEVNKYGEKSVNF